MIIYDARIVPTSSSLTLNCVSLIKELVLYIYICDGEKRKSMCNELYHYRFHQGIESSIDEIGSALRDSFFILTLNMVSIIIHKNNML